MQKKYLNFEHFLKMSSNQNFAIEDVTWHAEVHSMISRGILKIRWRKWRHFNGQLINKRNFGNWEQKNGWSNS